jgi:hypothetical protein
MGNSFIYDNAIISAFTTLVNFTTSTTKVFSVLGQVSPSLANKQAWATYNDIKWAASTPYEIAVVSTGYALGGSVCSNTTPVRATDTINFAVAALTYTASAAATIAATMASLQYAASSSTTTTNPLLSNHDLGGSQSVTGGTITLTWPSNIAFSLVSSAAS